MSSSSSSSAAAASSSSSSAAAATFWCHGCDVSVSVPLPAASPLLCSLCGADSLAPMPDPPRRPNYLYDSDSDDGPSPPPPPRRVRRRHIFRPFRGPRPAPQSAIDALPTVPIADPSLLCAVCTDEFGPGSPLALRLPCAHLYHSACVLPWLALRNSCPLCRAPISPDGHLSPPLSAEQDDWEQQISSLSSTLRIAALRHRVMLAARAAWLRRVSARLERREVTDDEGENDDIWLMTWDESIPEVETAAAGGSSS